MLHIIVSGCFSFDSNVDRAALFVVHTDAMVSGPLGMQSTMMHDFLIANMEQAQKQKYVSRPSLSLREWIDLPSRVLIWGGLALKNYI